MRAVAKASATLFASLVLSLISNASSQAIAQTARSAGPENSSVKWQDSIITPKAVCYIWAAPYLASDSLADASFSQCAVEMPPVLVSKSPMPGPPRNSNRVSGTYVLTIDVDGRVNRRLSRVVSAMGEDVKYFDMVADSMESWRFRPGMRNGKAVRSTFELEIKSDGVRSETAAVGIQWEYRSKEGAETLLAKWVAAAPVQALSNERLDSLYMAFLHKLVAMKVMVPLYSTQHCLVMHDGDEQTHARIQRRARVMSLDGGPFDYGVDNRPPFNFAPSGCERTPDPLRIILPKINLTENGRVTFQTGGDFLPNYPNNINGRSWRAWRAKCSGTVPENGAINLDCSVEVGEPSIEYAYWSIGSERERRTIAERSRFGVDSVWITAVISTVSSLVRDTIQFAIPSLPVISEYALVDTKSPCGGWVAFTEQRDSSGFFVIHGNPYLPARAMRMGVVQQAPMPGIERGSGCAAQTEQSAKLTAFVAGGIGGKATAPITLIFTGIQKPYTLDPSRHTMPAHLSFSIPEMRSARGGSKRLEMILSVDARHAVAPVIVLPVAGRARYELAAVTRVATNTFQIRASSDFPPDGKVFVYLIRLP